MFTYFSLFSLSHLDVTRRSRSKDDMFYAAAAAAASAAIHRRFISCKNRDGATRNPSTVRSSLSPPPVRVISSRWFLRISPLFPRNISTLRTRKFCSSTRTETDVTSSSFVRDRRSVTDDFLVGYRGPLVSDTPAVYDSVQYRSGWKKKNVSFVQLAWFRPAEFSFAFQPHRLKTCCAPCFLKNTRMYYIA